MSKVAEEKLGNTLKKRCRCLSCNKHTKHYFKAYKNIWVFSVFLYEPYEVFCGMCGKTKYFKVILDDTVLSKKFDGFSHFSDHILRKNKNANPPTEIGVILNG